MALTSSPSLLHLTVPRAALVIYKNDINDLFQVFKKEEKVYEQGSFYRIYIRQEEWVSERKDRVREKLSKLLPVTLINRIINLFQPLVDEVNVWFRDHYYVIKHIEKSHYENSLCWNWKGTVDRINTAKNLVQNTSIDKKLRFCMACIYFLEDDIRILWQSLKKIERQTVLSVDSNIAVQFWIRRLRESDQSSCLSAFLYSKFLEPSNRHPCSRVRISSFFNQLLTHYKGRFLHDSWPRHAHADDFLLCYNQFNDIERAEFLLLDANTKNVLFSYLQWPLQHNFFDVVDQMMSFWTFGCSVYMVRYIIARKLMRGIQDFDYLQLFRDFWYKIREEDKVMFRRHNLFTLVWAVMSYDEKRYPLPIGELLRETVKFQTVRYLRKNGPRSLEGRFKDVLISDDLR